jgi:hypothetical protein
MVKIVNYEVKQSSEGQPFIALILENSDIEFMQSATTGRFYAVVRKTSLSSSLTEEQAQRMIGRELPGSIQKEQCEPYEYVPAGSDEVLTLTHRYVYVPEPVQTQQTPALKVAA